MYDTYVKINEKFKSSVNLQYDLYNEEKILQYIPTTDLCDVLKQYLGAVINDKLPKSTFLVGPYGKGKSYLMLMITYLLSKRENRDVFSAVLSKIEKIDNELYQLLVKIDDKKISLLPVIINNNSFDDFNQNFMLAINDSLKNHNLGSIIPNTTYSECLEIINGWENEKKSDFDVFDVCINKLDISLSELKRGLSNYEINSYKQFEELFSCISHGYKYNPLVSNDIASLYSDVANKLEDFGYTGMFIIFDEFGAFLETETVDFVTRLNKLQALAEKCNGSLQNQQMHLCCITHKDLMLYSKGKTYKNSFETIAGRFKQIRFDRTLEENYQIICSALDKQENYLDLVHSNMNLEWLEELGSLNIFDGYNQVKYLFENSFPFNPVTLYVLNQVSEKVAQNERTLFTFISDNDIYGFKYFIANNDSGLLNVNHIYDYFENLIKENEEYKSLYLKVESLKRITLKVEAHDVLKTIAIIKLVNDSVKLPCNTASIAHCLNKEYEFINSLVDTLIKENVLKKNVSDLGIDFAVVPDGELHDLVDKIVVSKYLNTKTSDLLKDMKVDKYFVSNRYNFEYKMTRYFKTIYLEASVLKKLSDFSNLFEGEYCDGIVINLLNDDATKLNDIQALLQCKKSNIIIRYREDNLDEEAIKKIKSLNATNDLIDNKKQLSEHEYETIKLLNDDLMEEISSYLKKFYSTAVFVNSANRNESTIQECIYNSLVETYSKTVVINNEQINKNVISTVSAKARNTVIDCMLHNEDKDFGTTSAEATIKMSFEDSIESNDSIIRFIQNVLVNSNGNKTSFDVLINQLYSAPIGMRKGVMPLYLAKSITDITIGNSAQVDTVILYSGNTEIELNASNLNRIVGSPSQYYFCYAQVNGEKLSVIDELAHEFGSNITTSFEATNRNLVYAIKKYVSNLPQIVIKATNNDNLLHLSSKALRFKDMFLQPNLNNYDVIFNLLPKLLEVDILEMIDVINAIKQEYHVGLINYYETISNSTKEKFASTNGTIKAVYDLWKANYSYIDSIVFDEKEKRVFQALNNLGYNDIESINIISNSIMNSTVDSWNVKKENDYFNTIELFIQSVVNFDELNRISKDNFSEVDNDEYELSRLGNTLLSNLEETLEEYGAALSNEEKAIVLKKLLKNIMN